MNRKGLASGLLAVMFLLFTLAFFSLLGLTMWNQVNSTFQSMDNETISPAIKEKINNLSFVMNWGDKIFVLVFLALFIGFIITSFTMPTNDTVFFIIYMLFLVFISIIAMILSNGWHYLVNNPNFMTAASSLTFTNWFMSYQPIVVFVTGILGGLIFYSRKNSNPSVGVGGVDFGDDGDGL